jgi:hypothetical protein
MRPGANPFRFPPIIPAHYKQTSIYPLTMGGLLANFLAEDEGATNNGHKGQHSVGPMDSLFGNQQEERLYRHRAGSAMPVRPR